MITRTNFQSMFEMAEEVGEWDERQVTPVISDPQLHLSRSVRAQPFFLICEKDTVLMQTTGSGEAEFRYSGLRRTKLTVGDLLYVPGGTASKVQPHEESIYMRLKAKEPGLEAVAWFCTSCDSEVWRHEFNTVDVSSQQGYQEGCHAFNADDQNRTCGVCGTVQDQVDLGPYNWGELAKAQTAGATA